MDNRIVKKKQASYSTWNILSLLCASKNVGDILESFKRYSSGGKQLPVPS